jgi:hypothetical protein
MASVLIVVLDTSNRVYCMATLIVCTVQCSALLSSYWNDARTVPASDTNLTSHNSFVSSSGMSIGIIRRCREHFDLFAQQNLVG